MPETIITFTPSEWGASQKRKAIKARNAAIVSLIVMSLACGVLYWAAWGMVNN